MGKKIILYRVISFIEDLGGCTMAHNRLRVWFILSAILFIFLLLAIPQPVSLYAQDVIALTQTGQTKCYRGESPWDEVPCTATGQDGERRAEVVWPDPDAATLFFDDFNDNHMDTDKWTTRGNTVTEDEGIMKVETTVTDQGGNLYSKWIDFSPNAPLTIARKVKEHYGNNYYTGRMDVELDQAPDLTFGVTYENYSYSTYQECARHGFFLFRNSVNSHYCSASSDMSSEMPAVWDTWFDERLIYNPSTGLVEYFINDVKKGEINVGVLPNLPFYRTRLRFASGGWWTGHSTHMDNLVVSQIGGASRHLLAVSKLGTGSGTVANTTSGIDCGFTCSNSFTQDGTVTLTATPDPGSAFTSWSGCDSVSGNQCTVVMTVNKVVIATFTIIPTVTENPASGAPGTDITQQGSGFTPNGTAILHFMTPDGTAHSTKTVAVDANGGFASAYTIPQTEPAGIYTWWAVDGTTGLTSARMTYTVDMIVSLVDWEMSSRVVKGAVADGVSKVLVKIQNLPAGVNADSVQITVGEGNGSLLNDKTVINGVFRQTYLAPINYARDGHPEDRTDGSRDVEMVILINSQTTANPALALLKPPIVLLHGLWATSYTWDTLRLKLMNEHKYQRRYILAPSYKNSAPLSENRAVIRDAALVLLKNLMSDGYVAKKADVVAHSMGGLVAKLYGNESYIRSVTTVGTPHFGSQLADVLCGLVACQSPEGEMNKLQKWATGLLEKSGRPSRNGAIRDLMVESNQHCKDNPCVIDVPNYVIAGISPATDPSTIAFVKTLARIIKVANYIPGLVPTWLTVPINLVNDLLTLNQIVFDNESNDWIVAESSQEATWVGDDQSVVWHSSEPDDTGVQRRIVDFLHRTSGSSSSVRPQTPQVPQIGKRLPASVDTGKTPCSTGTVTITAPTDGQVFQPGALVTVTADVSNGNAIVMFSTSTEESTLLFQAPYAFEFTIPATANGPIAITAGAADSQGFIGSNTVTISVKSSANLTDLTIDPEEEPILVTAGSSIPLTVRGIFDDGVTRMLTADASYVSSSPDVVEVSKDGSIHAKLPGVASVTVSASGVSKTVGVTSVQETFELSLSAGWNFISVPKEPADPSIAVVLRDALTAVKVVWGYDNESKTWLRYYPCDLSGTPNTLDRIHSGKGYWVYLDAPGRLSVALTDIPVSVNLSEGWNLIGYGGMDRKFLSSALSTIANKWSLLWNWDNGTWYGRHETMASMPQPIQPLTNFYQGKAYWVKVKLGQGGSWVQ